MHIIFLKLHKEWLIDSILPKLIVFDKEEVDDST